MKKVFILILALWGTIGIGHAIDLQRAKIVPTTNISGSAYETSNGYYCMNPDIGSALQFNLIPDAGYRVVETEWTVRGGITETAHSNTAISVISQQDTTYSNLYNRYAKGHLTAKVILVRDHEKEGANCNGEKRYYMTHDTVRTEVEYELRKIFARPDNGHEDYIVGPNCVKEGEKVTYSVAPWVSLKDAGRIGFDDYVWTVESGLNQGDLYYSSDESSITFIVGEHPEGKTISVRMGGCNTTQTPMSLTTLRKPEAPQLKGYDFDTPICLSLAAETLELEIENIQPNCTYVWEKLGVWYPTDSYTLTAADNGKITLYPKSDAHDIRLRMISPCDEEVYILEFNRTLVDGLNKIVTNARTECATAGEQTRLEVEHLAEGMRLEWEIVSDENGWIMDDDQKQMTYPRVTVGNGTGHFRVKSSLCTGGEITGNISIKPQAPTEINGSSCIVGGEMETFVYTASETANAEEYEWLIPEGWTSTSEYTTEGTYLTESESITVASDGEHIGRIGVRAKGCEDSEWTWKEIGMLPDSPEILERSTCYNAGMSEYVYFSVGNYNATNTYAWDIPTDFGVRNTGYQNASDPSRISVLKSEKTGIFKIILTSSNTCGSKSDSIQIQVEKEGIAFTKFGRNNSTSYMVTEDYTEDDDWYDGHTGIWKYLGENVTNANDYTVTENTLPSGLLTSGTSDLEFILTNLETGCKSRYTNGIAGTFKSPRRGVQSEVLNESYETEMSITPNPTNGNVTIVLSTETPMEMRLYSMTGEVLKKWEHEGVSELDMSSYATGVYIVKAVQNNKQYIGKIVVNH